MPDYFYQCNTHIFRITDNACIVRTYHTKSEPCWRTLSLFCYLCTVAEPLVKCNDECERKNREKEERRKKQAEEERLRREKEVRDIKSRNNTR